MISFSIEFVNKNDELYLYASKIPELEGYDTIVCHGSEKYVYMYGNDDEEFEYGPGEFANLILNATGYTGKPIRLMSCNTGALEDGFAQRLSNILQVEVLAPTEAIWVNSYGEIFISNYDVLAQMWYEGKNINDTGIWKKFYPQKGGADEKSYRF